MLGGELGRRVRKAGGAIAKAAIGGYNPRHLKHHRIWRNR